MVINLPDIAKPIDTLFNRTADGIQGYLKPWQKKRIARAEVEVLKIKAQGELDLQTIFGQVQASVIEDQIQKSSNIHNITYEAEQEIPEGAEITSPEQDWFDHFKSKAEIVSDEKMQSLWGRVLAGELQSKGKYSKRTMDFISTLSVQEAELIEQLTLGIIWRGSLATLAVGIKELPNKSGASFGEPFVIEHQLIELSTMGVLNSQTNAILAVPHIDMDINSFNSPAWNIVDGSKRFRLIHKAITEEENQKLEPIEVRICTYTFSQLGIELASLANVAVDDNIAETVRHEVLRQITNQKIWADFSWELFEST